MADCRPCSGCGVEVWWVRHERTGKPSPLVHVPDGMKPNIMVFDREGEHVYRIRKKDDLADEHFRYINHFADCPKASSFRRSPNVS